MKRISMLFIILILWAGAANAAHPLITDDTGTQGNGNSQLEINADVSFDKETANTVTIKETASELAAVVSYGIAENADIIIGAPYQWIKVKEDGIQTDAAGISDMSIELKWRFYEKNGLSIALKPAVSLPAGDEEKGLGNGRSSYGVTFITSTASGPWEYHINLGYLHNEYEIAEDKAGNRKEIWHISFASTVEVSEGLKAVANIGIESNPDSTSKTHPAFILGGLIYSASDNFDVDVGVKAGLNNPEADTAILAGLALRF